MARYCIEFESMKRFTRIRACESMNNLVLRCGIDMTICCNVVSRSK
jgi:hypothetical protein